MRKSIDLGNYPVVQVFNYRKTIVAYIILLLRNTIVTIVLLECYLLNFYYSTMSYYKKIYRFRKLS